jgi:hypothetical protein
MTGAEHDHLRPVERRILRWTEIGFGDSEIARRFGRSERWVAQVRFLADRDRSAPLDQPDTSGRSATSARSADRLRPLERQLPRWRECRGPARGSQRAVPSPRGAATADDYLKEEETE